MKKPGSRSWVRLLKDIVHSTDTCLAMTIFRDEFDLKFVLLFASLLYLKIFHWIASDRIDFVRVFVFLSSQRWNK